MRKRPRSAERATTNDWRFFIRLDKRAGATVLLVCEL